MYAIAALRGIVDDGGRAIAVGGVMASGVRGMVDRLRSLAGEGAHASDAQLLEAFIARRDEAAFETIVRRHGAMVFGVCRRVLQEHHGAEDAFQATFLVLVKKAAAIRPRELVGNWLYGVAYHTARRVKIAAVKRRAKESQVRERGAPAGGVPAGADPWDELQPLLDEELSRLPDKYRVPIVLCDLEGKTRKDAARQLGWREGTLNGRLARARVLLAKRLTRRGVTLSGGLLAAALSEHVATAGVLTALIGVTLQAAALSATTTAIVSANVAGLTKGVMQAMFMSKLKTVALAAVAGIVVTTIIGVTFRSSGSVSAGESGQAAPARTEGQSRKPSEAPKKSKATERPLNDRDEWIVERPKKASKPRPLNDIDRMMIERWLNQKDEVGDAEFLRRVFLDLTGMLPTPAQTREFLNDKNPDRRVRVIERLLSGEPDNIERLAALAKYLDPQELRDAIERALVLHDVDRALKRVTEKIHDPSQQRRALEEIERRLKLAKEKLEKPAGK